MTRSTSGRIARRGKNPDVLQKAFEAGAKTGWEQGTAAFAKRLASSEGVALPDGRIARLVYFPKPAFGPNGELIGPDGEPVAAEAPGLNTPAPIGIVDPPQMPLGGPEEPNT